MRLSVDQIEIMDRAALIAAWNHLFATPVPKSLSQAFLRRFIAFEIQARRSGRLPKGFVADLERRTGDRRPASSPALKPGGRLLREEARDDGGLGAVLSGQKVKRGRKACRGVPDGVNR